MTLSEIEQDVYRRLGKATASPDTATQTRIRAFINQRLRRILSEVGTGRLRDDVFTVASVANTPRVALPQAITKVHRIFEIANGRNLRLMTLDALREYDPRSINYTGTPDYFVPLGYTAVAAQPSNASELFIQSNAAGDTQNLTVEGVLATGERRTVTKALTGVTPVSLASTVTTWTVIERVYVATAAVGTILVTEDSGAGAELARITVGRTAPRYYTVLLYPTPAAVITYYVDAEWEIADMSVAGDVPPLPDDFHYLLSVGARLDEYEKGDDEKRRGIVEREWAQGIIRLKWHLYGLQAKEGPPPRRSNLGPWFPANWW